jgi:hypothetical protein
VDAGVPGVAALSFMGGVVTRVLVGLVSGIGPQPASTARRTTIAIIDGTLRVLVMTPSSSAKSGGRINLHLSSKGNSALDPG